MISLLFFAFLLNILSFLTNMIRAAGKYATDALFESYPQYYEKTKNKNKTEDGKKEKTEEQKRTEKEEEEIKNFYYAQEVVAVLELHGQKSSNFLYDTNLLIFFINFYKFDKFELK